MQQYVYKLEKIEAPAPSAQLNGCRLITSLGDWGRWLFPVIRTLGAVEATKVLLQWIRGKKSIYFFAENKQIQSYGIITFGYCKLYDIEPTASVIGPVNTLSSCQGRGLATITLSFASAWLLNEQKSVAVYIDTAENNLRMQRVIMKIGFTGPIVSFPRTKVAR